MENLKCLFTNFPWDVFLFWLLPLLFIAGLVWWLMQRLVNKYKSHASELQDRINFLEGELEACRKNKVAATSSADVDVLKAQISKLEADLDACNKSKMAAAVAGAAAGAGITAPIASMAPKAQKKDDLKIVEGIGPKIEELCHDAGIYTFADLAASNYDTLKGILDNAGPRFQMHDPTTWPDQAALARDGKWDQLKAWQDELNKGRQ